MNKVDHNEPCSLMWIQELRWEMTRKLLRSTTLGCVLLVLMGPASPARATAPDLSKVDDVLATCPSSQDIASINSDFTLTFESDPTAGTLVCTAAEGSEDLTFLQSNVYQVLRVARQIPFDVPLPWTTKNLYDWLKGAIHGMRFRGDIGGSFCCDPTGVINILEAPNSTNVLTSRWDDPRFGFGLDTFLNLVVHEARHSEGLPHTCGGGSDQTISELGAWGVVYYYWEWLAFHSGTFLTATAPDIVGGGTDSGGRRLSPSYYREIAWSQAQSTRDGRICSPFQFLAAPPSLDFGTQDTHTTSAIHTIALTAGTSTPIEIRKVNLTGDDARDFTLEGPFCPNATAPPSCVLTVSFSPRGKAESKTAEIVIDDSASDSPHTVSLTGTATRHHPSPGKKSVADPPAD